MTDRPLTDSVRLALPAEADQIAAIQRRSWQQVLVADAADTLLSGVTTGEMTQAWHRAIARPPQARFRVLVALDAAVDRLAGFATTVPSQDADADPDDGAVDEFAIDPPAQRRGHGSRLLNACVDTLRADGFTRARWWVATDNDPLRTFLTEAGWAPDGAYREIGDDEQGRQIRIRQVRLHTYIAQP